MTVHYSLELPLNYSAVCLVEQIMVLVELVTRPNKFSLSVGLVISVLQTHKLASSALNREYFIDLILVLVDHTHHQVLVGLLQYLHYHQRIAIELAVHRYQQRESSFFPLARRLFLLPPQFDRLGSVGHDLLIDLILTLLVGLSIDDLYNQRVPGYDLPVVDHVLLLVQLANTFFIYPELVLFDQLGSTLEHHAQTISIEFADQNQLLRLLKLLQPTLPLELLATQLVILIAVVGSEDG